MAIVDGTFKRIQDPETGRQKGTTGAIAPMAVLDSGGDVNENYTGPPAATVTLPTTSRY